MKFVYSILIAVMLAGCGTAPVATQQVDVPVVSKCVNQTPAKPDYEVPKLPKTATAGEKIAAIARDLLRSKPYEAQLEAVIEGCK